MLASLSIKNYALIDELLLQLGDGLVILTGETGAGKSIIIGALGIVLGERASSDAVKSGAAKAVVEAVFRTGRNADLERLLVDHGLDRTDELILRREVGGAGQARCFINDTPVALAVLRQAGDLVVDLHGQHEHQSLLRPSTHIEYLNAFADLDENLVAYRESYERLLSLHREREELNGRREELGEKLDLYRFQKDEIDSVGPEPDEEDGLLREIRILENAEKLFVAVREIGEMLYDGEQSVFDLLSNAAEKFRSLSDIDGSFVNAVNETESAKAIVSELSRSLSQYTSGIDFSADRLESVRNRLGQLSLLKKKYGGSLESVIERRNVAAAALESTVNFEEREKAISEQIIDVRRRAAASAENLSAKRAAAALKLNEEVARILRTLGIPNAGFSVRVTPRTEQPSVQDNSPTTIRRGRETLALDNNGFDQVEFFVSMNLGEEQKPLARVASGGEISRVMLALKSVLAKRGRLPVVVFDEIDSGVSGRVAQAVGQCLKRLSSSLQVVVITHLPQIAALGDSHHAVTKTEERGKTKIRISQLNAGERVREIARLLSGARITDAALTGARELIRSCDLAS